VQAPLETCKPPRTRQTLIISLLGFRGVLGRGGQRSAKPSLTLSGGHGLQPGGISRQRLRCASAIRCLPSTLRGPVDLPPCGLHLALRGTPVSGSSTGGAWHG